MQTTADLQLKKVPARIKSLITREATVHHRSMNQEAIALLEEALLARAQRQTPTRDEIDEILDRYNSLPDRSDKPLSEMIEFDELGLPK
ncbi:MAG: Arc family DNA-binding protein [Burkholderiales bacterium]|nr:Arc family DNA-binding protein [Burkholderiales bacterium]